MITSLIIRFFVGGAIVSLFAVAGELFKPKTFAGIFGAAPSVAIASLMLLAAQEGPERTALQGYAMAWGALALFAYSVTLTLLMRHLELRAWLEAVAEWSVWLLLALGGWRLLLVT
jgi:uncharacterized membrane protein (GlpM family)